MNTLRRFHARMGLSALLVFLATGAYMKLAAHPERLPDGEHLMFVSRHIYILANALVHLSLAAYAVPFAAGGARKAQWIGSTLLAASSALLIAAFAVEPMAGGPRSFASTFGIYTLFAGAILHFAAALRRGARE